MKKPQKVKSGQQQSLQVKKKKRTSGMDRVNVKGKAGDQAGGRKAKTKICHAQRKRSDRGQQGRKKVRKNWNKTCGTQGTLVTRENDRGAKRGRQKPQNAKRGVPRKRKRADDQSRWNRRLERNKAGSEIRFDRKKKIEPGISFGGGRERKRQISKMVHDST